MNVLLLRPNPGNERFGLGPFFRVEPLGLEYIGAALRTHGHAPTVADLRFRPGTSPWVRRPRPRAGYTILTPLPGTEYFRKLAPRLAGQPWSNYDMHHVLWEPRLGAKRFFELYAETWRKSILNASGEKRWVDWMRQIRPAQIPYLASVLWRTQRMMKAGAYIGEYGKTNRAPMPVEYPSGTGALR